MNRILIMPALIFFCLLFFCKATFAEIYQYVDDDGIIHMTNVPSNQYNYKLILIGNLHTLKNKKIPTTRELSEIIKKANARNASAQACIGGLYYYGQGVPEDRVKAAAWLQKAATQGNAESQELLGTMYYNGQGVPKDIAQATMWLQKAAAQGSNYAKTILVDKYYQRINNSINMAESGIRNNSKKQSNIEGIGILKIGKADVSDLKKEWEIQLQKEDIYCPDLKEYLMPLYSIADIHFYNLKLRFYKNILFEIYWNDSNFLENRKLLEALELKYGKPDKEIYKNTISCLYNLTGNRVPLDQYTTKSRWENGNIKAENVVRTFYDSNCESQVNSHFRIYDSKMSWKVLSCGKGLREQEQKENTQKRLKELNDF